MLKNIMMSTMAALVCFGQLCSESEGMFSKPKKEATTPAQTYEMKMQEYENDHQTEDFVINTICVSGGSKILGPGFFSLAPGLTSVTLPNGLEYVKTHTFYGCKNLKYVTFGTGLVCISNGAFEDCPSLIIVSFRNVPEFYGSQVFQGCGHAVQVELIERGASEKGSISVTCSDVWELQKRAGRPDMYVNFTDHFTPALNDKNINFCKDLTALNFDGEAVPAVFAACCPCLTSAVLKTEVVEKGAFAGCAGLMHMRFRTPVESLEDYCFCDCAQLISVRLPNSVKSISNRAFQNCIHLVFVYMNQGLEEIGIDAFYNCSNLSYINLPRSLKRIGAGAFAYTSLKRVPPWPLDHIPTGCFMGCPFIKSVDTQEFREIGINAFKDCVGLKKVKIWPGVQVLDNAFEGCKNLEMVEILAPNVRLCNGSFINCQSLEIVNITRPEYASRFLENSASSLDYSCDNVFDPQVQFAAEGQLFTQNP